MNQSRHLRRNFKHCNSYENTTHCHCFDYIYRDICKPQIEWCSALYIKRQNTFISSLKFYFIFSCCIKFYHLIFLFPQHLESTWYYSTFWKWYEEEIINYVLPSRNFAKQYKNKGISYLERRISVSHVKLLERRRHMVKECLFFSFLFSKTENCWWNPRKKK